MHLLYSRHIMKCLIKVISNPKLICTRICKLDMIFLMRIKTQKSLSYFLRLLKFSKWTKRTRSWIFTWF